MCKVQVTFLTCFPLLSVCCHGWLFLCFFFFKHRTEENYDYYMLCGSGNCHCFHHRGNAGLNPGHSRTTRHANTQQSKNTQDKNTQQSKNTTDSHFQFPVSWMQSTTCNILKDTFYRRCTGPEVLFAWVAIL